MPQLPANNVRTTEKDPKRGFIPMQRRLVGTVAAIAFLALSISPSLGQFSFESAPILYGRSQATDKVAAVAQQLASGELNWKRDSKHDYLADLLKALDIPVSSQVLVFSKTSLQLHRISPQAPRAIYFNDDVYVAWVQDGYMIEIGAMDDSLGGVFYTMPLNGGEPRLNRDRGGCIACHASSRTQRVPGFFIRSVIPREDGRPRDTGTVTDHRSPFHERWGGWYVTGTHGAMRHLGNEVSLDPDDPEKLDIERGSNLTSVADRFDTGRYLTPHSDLVALLVLEHQMQMHNYITLANYETRRAIDSHHEQKLKDGKPVDELTDATKARITAAGDKLVDYMLFCGEAELQSKVVGTSTYAEEFMQQGPRDSKGRSLRQLDLTTRLFRYPCSYLIYSSSFNALPTPVATYVQDRLLKILRGDESDAKYSHLTMRDRLEILEILEETKPEWFTEKFGNAANATGSRTLVKVQKR